MDWRDYEDFEKMKKLIVFMLCGNPNVKFNDINVIDNLIDGKTYKENLKILKEYESKK